MTDLIDVCILAAGKGTRMKSKKPKVLHEVAGKPMLGHVLDQVGGLAANQTIIVIGSGADQVRDAFAGTSVTFVEQTEQLGTGHAVQQAIPKLGSERTLILVGDAPLITLASLQRLLATEGELVVMTADHPNPFNYGRIIREGDEVIAIIEERDTNEAQKQINEINTGVMVANTKALRRWLAELNTDNDQGEYLLTDIVDLARQEGGRVTASKADSFEEALGINNFSQLADVERIYQRRVARHFQMEGVHIVDSDRFTLRGNLVVGQDVFIDVDCIFEGEVELGDGVKIGANCVIRDAKIGADTEIKPFTHIDGVTMEAGCSAGPFSRLRPGTHFESGVAVGNFVEVKKSRLGAGTKASHLSYLGDATIGKEVNIGAGAITCNYDGVNKFETHIEDGVFVGVNAAMVAPITIGEWSTIAAGSTITAKVPERTLGVGRSRQRNIEGWKGPRDK